MASPLDISPELPDNPNDDYYLKNCYVCQEKAKPGQVHIRNYGAIVCLSCRAFWRRAHQRTRNPTYICRRSDECVITVKNRRSCQKCRYRRCVDAGMDIDAVLTEEQRQVRFRRAIEKRNRQRATSSKRSTTAESVPDSNSSTFQLESNEVQKRVDPSRAAGIMQPKVLQIKASFDDAKNASHDFSSDVLSENFNNFLCNDDISRDEILLRISKLSEEFARFAESQRQFSRLSTDNQRALLEQNSPLYAQLCLGALLNGDHVKLEVDDDDEDVFELQRDISLVEMVFDKLKLFRSSADVADYKSLALKLGGVASFEQNNQRAILANIILFRMDCSPDLKSELEDVAMLNELIFDTFVRDEGDDCDMKDFTETLSQMALFFSHNVDWNTTPDPFRQLDIGFTEEEDQWLKNQIKIVDRVFRSVEFGSDMIFEFLMHSLGVPLSKTFTLKLFNAMNERIQRLVHMSPEFEELPVQQQRRLSRLNCPLALALYAGRGEILTCGMQQLSEGMGEQDEKYWLENCASVFDTREKIAHLSMRAVVELGVDQWERYSFLVERTKVLCYNADFFKLNLLFLLTGTHGKSTLDKGLSKLNRKYEVIIRRRLAWKRDWLVDVEGADEMSVDEIFSRFSHLKDLAKFIQEVVTSHAQKLSQVDEELTNSLNFT